MVLKCAKCGAVATKENDEGVPLCAKHSKSNAKIKTPLCPECGLTMNVRKGKFGAFWGCIAFPMCNGIRKI